MTRITGVRADQRRQDAHHRGLAGAVGAEQGKDRSFGDCQVDVVKHVVVTV
jgi:hypothetical protein